MNYNYDNTGSGTTKGLLLSVTMTNGGGAIYSESFSYDGTNQVSSRSWTRDSRTYTIGYQYNTAGQLTRLNYPSGRQVAMNHDSNGRLSSITEPNQGTPVPTYLSSTTYNAAGQLTGDSLGNGVSETYGYDANRSQLTSQTAAKGSTSLMNLSYSYQASSGQMGSGSTAGNAGQSMSISGTINSTTESASYTYDNVGRLVTSSQTTNGASAQRRFAYDRWGNRTGVWDATSGGNQIQSIALQQSSGVTTNQIQSVTAGSTLNYTYDAAGNVTNDGAHNYTYDAENRLVSVDSGSTVEYRYDYRNCRVKKTVGSRVTHSIWESGLVLCEYNVSTGAQIIDYVYSGSRLIAEGAGSTMNGSGSTTFLLSDRLSIRVSLDKNGNLVGQQGHLPFGEQASESGTQEKHHFTSYERDSETGTDYAVNRQYSQGIGRFMRTDPYAGSYEYGNPQSLNRYAYVHNDPINKLDPDGLDGLTCRWVLVPLYDSEGELTGLDHWVIVCEAGTPQARPTGPGRRAPQVLPDCGDAVDKDLDAIDALIRSAKGAVHGIQVSLLEFATNPANGEVDPGGSAILDSLNENLDRFVYNPQLHPGTRLSPGRISNRFKDLGRRIVDYLQPERAHGQRQQELIGLIGSFARIGLKSLDLIDGFNWNTTA